MQASTGSHPSPDSDREALVGLLDAIECAVTGRECAGAQRNLQALREELLRHIDGQSWLDGLLGEQAGSLVRLAESTAAIRGRLLDLRDALREEDHLAAVTCVDDLRGMISAHLELERQVASALAGNTGGAPRYGHC